MSNKEIVVDDEGNPNMWAAVIEDNPARRRWRCERLSDPNMTAVVAGPADPVCRRSVVDEYFRIGNEHVGAAHPMSLAAYACDPPVPNHPRGVWEAVHRPMIIAVVGNYSVQLLGVGGVHYESEDPNSIVGAQNPSRRHQNDGETLDDPKRRLAVVVPARCGRPRHDGDETHDLPGSRTARRRHPSMTCRPHPESDWISGN